jgi:hypothetical protein
MSLLSLARRLFVFLLFTAIPFAALGFAIAELEGLACGLLVFALVLVFASAKAERGVLKIYHVRAKPPEGASRSLERVAVSMGGDAPRILSFSDPAPQALVTRGLSGPGSILISEGLLGALSEEELRELLRACVTRLRRRGVRFQTLCAWLSHGALELAPRPWIELVFGELRWHESLGVWGALRFVSIFSVSHFFADLGRVAVVDAPRALRRLPTTAGEVINPGSRFLHLKDPWASRGLI